VHKESPVVVGRGAKASISEMHESFPTLSWEAPMRTTSEAAAVRSAFYAVLREMPEDKLRKLILDLLLAPLTMTTQHRKRGRQPIAVAEGNVVPLPPKNGRKRRRKAVDEAKLAERRKRNAANRKARRHAARAAMNAAEVSAADVEAMPERGEPVTIPPRRGNTAVKWVSLRRLRQQAPDRPPQPARQRHDLLVAGRILFVVLQVRVHGRSHSAAGLTRLVRSRNSGRSRSLAVGLPSAGT
jgi:hypothetical protein